MRWLAENSEASQQRLRVETDKIIYHPGQEIEIDARPTTKRAGRRTATGWLPACAARTSPRSRPFDETAHSLAPEPKDVTYHGKLPAPQPAEILAGGGTTLHKFIPRRGRHAGRPGGGSIERRAPDH